MIEYENDPVWTPIDLQDGDPYWRDGVDRELLAVARRKADGLIGYPSVARWDAEAQQWVIALPAHVEVTGVPSRWRVVDKDGLAVWGSFADKPAAWSNADRYSNCHPDLAPFSVEACIPVPRNEAS